MPQDEGFESVALNRIMADLEPMAEAAAGMMGMPPGGKKYSEQEQLEMWNHSPLASPQERVMTMLQLKSLGKTDEEITDAVYPNRRKVIEASHPSPTKRIQYAKDMEQLMQRKATEMGIQLPSPEQAMPEGVEQTKKAAELGMRLPSPEQSMPLMPEGVGQPEMAAPLPEQPTSTAPSPLDVPLSSLMGG